jgi:hypothetical protein
VVVLIGSILINFLFFGLVYLCYRHIVKMRKGRADIRTWKEIVDEMNEISPSKIYKDRRYKEPYKIYDDVE